MLRAKKDVKRINIFRNLYIIELKTCFKFKYQSKKKYYMKEEGSMPFCIKVHLKFQVSVLK